MNKSRRQYLKKVQDKFKYKFTNLDILNEAIERTEVSDSYEFFGDIALYGAVTDFMIRRYTENTRYNLSGDFTKGGIDTLVVGKLSEIKGKLVSNTTFALIIRSLDLVKDMPLSEEDERNGVRENNHRLGDLYERIIGAIAIDSTYYKGGADVAHISKIYAEHIEPILKYVHLPEYLEDNIGNIDFARENVLTKEDLSNEEVDEVTLLKLLSDKKKLPEVNYDFITKRTKDNVIVHHCSVKFPKDSNVKLRCWIHDQISEQYQDFHEWPSSLFDSTACAKTKSEAKMMAAHYLLNKLKIRYDVTFLEFGGPTEIGQSVKLSDIKIVIAPHYSRLNRNVEVSDKEVKKNKF